MSLNYWSEIQKAYFSEANFKNLIGEIWRYSSKEDKKWLVSSGIGGILSAVLGLLLRDTEWFFLFSEVVTGALFLYRWIELEDQVLCNLGVEERSKLSPKKAQIEKTSYALFKKHLNDKRIMIDDVKNCNSLIEMQIDILSSSPSGLKKAVQYFLAILTGIGIGLFGEFDFKVNLGAMLLVLFLIGVLYWLANTVIIPKLEKMKELKYFMLLYCYEAENH